MPAEAEDPAAYLAEQARNRVIPGASWAVCRGEETISAGAVGWASLVPHRRKELKLFLKKGAQDIPIRRLP